MEGVLPEDAFLRQAEGHGEQHVAALAGREAQQLLHQQMPLLWGTRGTVGHGPPGHGLPVPNPARGQRPALLSQPGAASPCSVARLGSLSRSYRRRLGRAARQSCCRGGRLLRRRSCAVRLQYCEMMAPRLRPEGQSRAWAGLQGARGAGEGGDAGAPTDGAAGHAGQDLQGGRAVAGVLLTLPGLWPGHGTGFWNSQVGCRLWEGEGRMQRGHGSSLLLCSSTEARCVLLTEHSFLQGHFLCPQDPIYPGLPCSALAKASAGSYECFGPSTLAQLAQAEGQPWAHTLSPACPG